MRRDRGYKHSRIRGLDPNLQYSLGQLYSLEELQPRGQMWHKRPSSNPSLRKVTSVTRNKHLTVLSHLGESKTKPQKMGMRCNTGRSTGGMLVTRHLHRATAGLLSPVTQLPEEPQSLTSCSLVFSAWCLWNLMPCHESPGARSLWPLGMKEGQHVVSSR